MKDITLGFITVGGVISGLILTAAVVFHDNREPSDLGKMQGCLTAQGVTGEVTLSPAPSGQTQPPAITVSELRDGSGLRVSVDPISGQQTAETFSIVGKQGGVPSASLSNAQSLVTGKTYQGTELPGSAKILAAKISQCYVRKFGLH